MKKKVQYTRHEASQYLFENDNSRSSSQWYSFLGDNARGRVLSHHRVNYSKSTNKIVLYQIADLDLLLKVLKADDKQFRIVKDNGGRSVELAFGSNVKENDNGYGQNFGYKWKGGSVHQIVGNHDKSPDASVMQLIINHPLRVSALSIKQAKELTQDLINEIAYIDKSYQPQIV